MEMDFTGVDTCVHVHKRPLRGTEVTAGTVSCVRTEMSKLESLGTPVERAMQGTHQGCDSLLRAGLGPQSKDEQTTFPHHVVRMAGLQGM